MMKKTWVACAAGLLLVTGSASAVSLSGEAGSIIPIWASA